MKDIFVNKCVKVNGQSPNKYYMLGYDKDSEETNVIITL